MGIPYLNSYIKKNTRIDAIKQIQLSTLSGKIIVIDTSIYLYRFMGEGLLLENMYIMISLFRYYNIIPIFVFDGKAPLEKTKLLEKRNKDKIMAETQYNRVKDQMLTITNNDEYQELSRNLLSLKKKFIRLHRNDIIKVKELMSAFGVTFIEATGEADQLCAKLVIKKYAYACLSEDMDLFVYGCPRVLRYLSLLNETVIIYYLDKILEDLQLTYNEFKEICILSGTDYNNNDINLLEAIEYFKAFKEKNLNIEFYSWLDNIAGDEINIYELYNAYNMFIIDNLSVKNYKTINLIKPINYEKIKELMIPEGFIFL